MKMKYFFINLFFYYSIDAYSQTLSYASCGKCGKEVSIKSTKGDRCPYCGVLWRDVNERNRTTKKNNANNTKAKQIVRKKGNSTNISNTNLDETTEKSYSELKDYSFTINDLILLSKYKLESMEHVISPKGYTYRDSEDRSYVKSTTFEYKNKSLKSTYTYSTDQYGWSSISWTTTNQADFIRILNQVKEQRIPLTSSDSHLCSKETNYKISDEYSLELIDISSKNKECDNIVLFGIKLKYRQ